MLNLENIEYITTYNISLFVIYGLIFAFAIVFTFVLSYVMFRFFYWREIVFCLSICFIFLVLMIYPKRKVNYAKVEIVDKEKYIELLGNNLQDRCKYIKSDGNKLYYYALNSSFENENELKNSIQKKFNELNFEIERQNKAKFRKSL